MKLYLPMFMVEEEFVPTVGACYKLENAQRIAEQCTEEGTGDFSWETEWEFWDAGSYWHREFLIDGETYEVRVLEVPFDLEQPGYSWFVECDQDGYTGYLLDDDDGETIDQVTLNTYE